MNDIIINLAVEDKLSEAILREILKQSQPQRHFLVGTCLTNQGYGYLKRIIRGLNHAAQGMPYLVLTDLDKAECPLAIISEWLPQPKHPNLIFRIAVREVEAWLLAHRQALAKFLGVSVDLIPRDADAIPDPKELIINLARKSKKRKIRDAIAPVRNSTAKIGKDYNGQLIQFVQHNWQAKSAQVNSRSLQRTIQVLMSFEPTY